MVDVVVTGGHIDAEGAPLLRTCMEPVMLHFRFPPPEGGAQTGRQIAHPRRKAG
jgi:hypothetical protein